MKFTAGAARGPAVWRDRNGVTHQAVGNQMVSFDRGTFIMWTRCGKHDIPANGAWISTLDVVDCPQCKAGRAK